MAEYTKQLHYLRNGAVSDIKLYTSRSDVASPNFINADGTTGGIKLYTSADDVDYPYVRLMDGDTPVYAQLKAVSDNSGKGIYASANGNDYALTNVIPSARGIALLNQSSGAWRWQRVNSDGSELEDTNFSNAYPWNEIETVTLDGQTMVKIPKFYIKHETHTGKKIHLVSRKKLPGYHIYPAFVRNSFVTDCFYIGAYEAYNAGSSKAGSKAGQTPWSGFSTFSNAKTYCTNRGTGWHMNNVYEVYAINWLMLIEAGTAAIETVYPRGNTPASSIMSTGTTGAVWRGIYEWWGNSGELFDGFFATWNSNGTQIYSNRGDDTYIRVSGSYEGIRNGWLGELSEESGEGYDLADIFISYPSNRVSKSYSAFNGYPTFGDYTVTVRKTNEFGSWAYGGLPFSVSTYGEPKYTSEGTTFRIAKYGALTAEPA